METLKINIPVGFMIDGFDPATNEIKLKAKPQKITERILTVTDVLAENGLNKDEFDELCEGLEEDEKAYRLLKLLVKSLNEGWLPDWSNSSEYKYYAWFEMRGSSGFRYRVFDGWGSGSAVGSRLCFKSRELAEHAGKHFTSVYEKFMVIK